MRKDTLSHAYELMKVEDPRKRRKLAGQVARNELSLVKLRERIEGRRPRAPREDDPVAGADADVAEPEADADWAGRHGTAGPIRDDSLVAAKQHLNEAVEDLIDLLRHPEVMGAIGAVDRANLAKYLTIAKLRLENAIALVRSDDAGY